MRKPVQIEQVHRASIGLIKVEYWTGKDPFQWSIQSSVDGLNEWEPEPEVKGEFRIFPAPSTGMYYRVAASGLDGNLLNQWSNIIKIR